jgi:hypothetical protein
MSMGVLADSKKTAKAKKLKRRRKSWLRDWCGDSFRHLILFFHMEDSSPSSFFYHNTEVWLGQNKTFLQLEGSSL